MPALTDPRFEVLAHILALDRGASLRAAAEAAGFPPGMVKGKSYLLARRADVQQRISEIRANGAALPPPPPFPPPRETLAGGARYPVASDDPPPTTGSTPADTATIGGPAGGSSEDVHHTQALAVSAMGSDDLRRWLTGIAALSVLRAQEQSQHRVVLAGVGELGKLHGLHSVRVDHQHSPVQITLEGLPARALGAILDGLARIESAMADPEGHRYLDLTLDEARALGAEVEPSDANEHGRVRMYLDTAAFDGAHDAPPQEVPA